MFVWKISEDDDVQLLAGVEAFVEKLANGADLVDLRH
jgi:hypothetical protein